MCERRYEIVAQYPHDPDRFTQGLVLHHGELYESAGGYGESALYRTRLRDRQLLRSARLPDEVFAEGLTRLGQQLVLLSWREGLGMVYDLDLALQRRFAIRGEGWGLTTLPGPDGERLLMSDGSAFLRLLRPSDFTEIGRIEVRENDEPVQMLNELEFAQGKVYANIWLTDGVVAIDPSSGTVLERLDLSALRTRFTPPPGWNARENVLNGIAYDAENGHLLVTGKRWPLLFELKLGDCSIPRTVR